MAKKSQLAYVYWHSPTSRWYGRFRFAGELIHVGYFLSDEEAGRAVDEAVKSLGIAESGKELFDQRGMGLGRRKTRLQKILDRLATPQPEPKPEPSPVIGRGEGKRIKKVWGSEEDES